MNTYQVVNLEGINDNSKTITVEFGKHEDAEQVFDAVYNAVKHTKGTTGIRTHNVLPDWVIKPTIFYITDDGSIVECYLEENVYDNETVKVVPIGTTCEIENIPEILTKDISDEVVDGVKRFCWMMQAAISYSAYRRK